MLMYKKILLFFAFAVLLLNSCSMPNGGSKRTVMVTIEPLRYFVEAIAGNRFTVKTMVPIGGNPETYDPTAQQMIELSHSDLYVKVGNIGFEQTWMKRLKANAPHTIIVDSSEGIVPIESSDDVPDPHTWMSCQNAAIIAQNIYKALLQIDREDSLYYKANLEKLLEKIEETSSQIRENITKEKVTTFLIYHPILTYYANEFDLHQIFIEDEGREPSAAQIKEIINSAKAKQVRVLIMQKEFANRNSETIANAVGAEIVDFNPLAYDWEKEMVKVSKSLK